MTVFIEIIQRIGCDRTPDGFQTEQAAGCGGFGKVCRLIIYSTYYILHISMPSLDYILICRWLIVYTLYLPKLISFLQRYTVWVDAVINIFLFTIFLLLWQGNFSELFKSIEDFEKAQEKDDDVLNH